MKSKVQRVVGVVFVILSVAIWTVSQAAESRGLAVVAKDPTTNITSEVRLYNKTWAVIVGIDRYQNLPADRQLKNAVNDAKGVQEILTRRYQFDRIVTLYDEQATKDHIMEVLTEELPTQMGKNDALFVFWAGHGNQEKSDYGDLGYLIPFDGSTDKIRKNLTMAEIRDTISKKLPAKHVFYVMDACYSGLLTTRSVDNKTRRDLAYLKEITKESVRQVLTAGGKNEEALDGGPKGHSVFTGRLIELLENADNFITANELQAAIREKVYSDAKGRNHTQTPGFGSLYGLGDFVFIPLKQDRLGDLGVTSVAKQKELEFLKKAEADAAVAKQKEQQEIARKKAEVDALDRQIAEMKLRLGSGTARSTDSLDAILAMAEQKEQQGLKLEELRRQRESEEQKRQLEIERLKREAATKRVEQIKADVAKYQKVASSKYAQDMAGSAWDALIANYPEANGVKIGDVATFYLRLGMQGNVFHKGDIWNIYFLDTKYSYTGKLIIEEIVTNDDLVNGLLDMEFLANGNLIATRQKVEIKRIGNSFTISGSNPIVYKGSIDYHADKFIVHLNDYNKLSGTTLDAKGTMGSVTLTRFEPK